MTNVNDKAVIGEDVIDGRYGPPAWYTLDELLAGDIEVPNRSLMSRYEGAVRRTERAVQNLLVTEALDADTGGIGLQRKARVQQGYAELVWVYREKGRGGKVKWLNFSFEAFTSVDPGFHPVLFKSLEEIEDYRQMLNLNLRHCWGIYLGLAEILSVPETERFLPNQLDRILACARK